MREVIAIRVPPGCLRSAPVREYELSAPVDEALMHRLAEGGTLQYFPTFPRPLFRIDRPQEFCTQGIVGSPVLRVTFSPSSDAGTREALRLALGGGTAEGEEG